ncbi:HlyD family efflux transporter periplasmic adaptor subunit [Rothia nasimurium]|uniref:HlyD family efflux transporter periplasmic adaptor subunit n=1 Tax=Luteibacter anthropi TaxID=564369 RepID=A0A7X5U7N3_9GAMM|nr:HlyD family efflux transporter periplasmic adaptor subunit [Luteibacter anthropi]NII05342.1 HlyD family efflux transporter periplasmic adaptor subunit [Luteibacter anthropi]
MDIPKPSHSIRYFPLWMLAACVGGVALIGLSATRGKASPSVARTELWIGTAQRGQMNMEIRAGGTLVPRRLRWITAGTTATVQEVLVEPGARVEASTVIVRMTNPELQANLQKQQAALAGAQASVSAVRTSLDSQLLDLQATVVQAEADLHMAEVKKRANEGAFRSGATTAIEVEQSRITVAQDERKLAIQRQRVSALRANMVAQQRSSEALRDQAASALEIARQQVDAMTVRAGIDGILQQVDVEPGQQIAAGAKLARVARPDDLMARLQVPETLAAALMLDLPVDVDTRNGVARGSVIRVDPSVRNGSVTVDAAFDAPLPKGARPDLSVDGRIVLGTLPDVVNIGRPYASAPDTTATVFVIHPGESMARRVPVRFGKMSSDRTAVSEGLRVGDQVILSDTSRWSGYDTLQLR